MDTLLHRIEWSTLLFFAAMFIQLECLERLRLISWFSQQTINLITLSDDPDVQLVFAIIILMWVSQMISENYIFSQLHLILLLFYCTLISKFCSFRGYCLALLIQFQ